MNPLGTRKYDGETLWLWETSPLGKWHYTTEELRSINRIRKELISAGHPPDIINRDIQSFIDGGWFYERNPDYNNNPRFQ